ncbi:MAG: class I SAM-dependent methyltransferase, partial [Planctomycetota bacterium]
MAYVHGYSGRETQRLYEQAEILEGILHTGTEYPAGAKVLEAGCGVGAQTRLLVKHSPDARFTCIDISEKSLATAKKLKEQDGFDNVAFQQADIHSLDFAAESFDHVFICFVLEHLDDPVAALTELKRVLKPAGTITCIEGDHGSCFWHPETEVESCQPAWLYADRLTPDLRDGMVNHIIVPMVQSAERQILKDNLVLEDVYRKGIADLERVDQIDEGT